MRFALDLSKDGISLFERLDNARWRCVDTVKLQVGALRRDLARLHALTGIAEGSPSHAEVWLPCAEVQVHTIDLRHASDIPGAVLDHYRAHGTGAPETLSYDFDLPTPDGLTPVVAIPVAVLREARDFLAEHGFHAACFTTADIPAGLSRPPEFALYDAAETAAPSTDTPAPAADALPPAARPADTVMARPDAEQSAMPPAGAPVAVRRATPAAPIPAVPRPDKRTAIAPTPSRPQPAATAMPRTVAPVPPRPAPPAVAARHKTVPPAGVLAIAGALAVVAGLAVAMLPDFLGARDARGLPGPREQTVAELGAPATELASLPDIGGAVTVALPVRVPLQAASPGTDAMTPPRPDDATPIGPTLVRIDRATGEMAPDTLPQPTMLARYTPAAGPVAGPARSDPGLNVERFAGAVQSVPAVLKRPDESVPLPVHTSRQPDPRLARIPPHALPDADPALRMARFAGPVQSHVPGLGTAPSDGEQAIAPMRTVLPPQVSRQATVLATDDPAFGMAHFGGAVQTTPPPLAALASVSDPQAIIGAPDAPGVGTGLFADVAIPSPGPRGPDTAARMAARMDLREDPDRRRMIDVATALAGLRERFTPDAMTSPVPRLPDAGGTALTTAARSGPAAPAPDVPDLPSFASDAPQGITLIRSAPATPPPLATGPGVGLSVTGGDTLPVMPQRIAALQTRVPGVDDPRPPPLATELTAPPPPMAQGRVTRGGVRVIAMRPAAIPPARPADLVPQSALAALAPGTSLPDAAQTGTAEANAASEPAALPETGRIGDPGSPASGSATVPPASEPDASLVAALPATDAGLVATLPATKSGLVAALPATDAGLGATPSATVRVVTTRPGIVPPLRGAARISPPDATAIAAPPTGTGRVTVIAARPDIIPPPRPDDALFTLLEPTLAQEEIAALVIKAQREGTLEPSDDALTRQSAPRARPAGMVKAAREAEIELAALAPSDVALQEAQTPRMRPGNLRDVSPAAVPTSTRRTDPPPVQRVVPAAPQLPTVASVARAATIENVLPTREMALIGVYGGAKRRQALVRLPGGRYVKVAQGDSVSGYAVTAISADAIRLRKSGRDTLLVIPN